MIKHKEKNVAIMLLIYFMMGTQLFSTMNMSLTNSFELMIWLLIPISIYSMNIYGHNSKAIEKAKVVEATVIECKEKFLPLFSNQYKLQYTDEHGIDRTGWLNSEHQEIGKTVMVVAEDHEKLWQVENNQLFIAVPFIAAFCMISSLLLSVMMIIE